MIVRSDGAAQSLNESPAAPLEAVVVGPRHDLNACGGEVVDVRLVHPVVDFLIPTPLGADTGPWAASASSRYPRASWMLGSWSVGETGCFIA